MAGSSERSHRVKATIGDVQINAELQASEGRFSLQVSPKINKPGTSDALLQAAVAGTKLTVEHEGFSELGARISWLRSGYLALFAAYGYDRILDPASAADQGKRRAQDGHVHH
jgi:hypothetical protein